MKISTSLFKKLVVTPAFVILLAEFVNTPQAYALIDMKTSNFTFSLTDWEALPGSVRGMRIMRGYNSRSLHVGYFGFGWCTDLLETKITLTPEGSLQLKECGAGMEVLYVPKGQSKKDVDKVISEILVRAKSKRKLDDQKTMRLQEELLADADLRIALAEEYKVKGGQLAVGAEYSAMGRAEDRLKIEKQGNELILVRSQLDGSKQKFQKVGRDYRVTYYANKAGDTIALDYGKDGVLRELIDNLGNRLRFTILKGRIVNIQGPRKLNLEYKYENFEDLSYSKDALGNTYTYVYDDYHNMIKRTHPDGRFVSLKYDTKKDWVKAFTDLDGCEEIYDWELNPKDPANNYVATLKKTCEGKVVLNARHEFWFETKSDGTSALKKAESKTNDDLMMVEYHPKFASPVSIIRNGQKVIFEYYANGMVKQKTGPDYRTEYKYHPQTLRLAKVVQQGLDAKGRVIRTREFEYGHDNRGNINLARSGKMKVELTWDMLGRVDTITDHSRQRLKLEYDERVGKPKKVTGVGVGSVVLTYKPNGDLDQVESGTDLKASGSILATFQNYLDLIMPATAEIFN